MLFIVSVMSLIAFLYRANAKMGEVGIDFCCLFLTKESIIIFKGSTRSVQLSDLCVVC